MTLLGQRALNLLHGLTGSSGDRGPTLQPTDFTAHFIASTRVHNMYQAGYPVVVPEGTPQDTEVLTFGKHVAQTFLTASIENPKHCEWVMGIVTDPHSDQPTHP
jgi:hypothetical protein